MKQRYLAVLLASLPLATLAIQVTGYVAQPTCGLSNGSITAQVTGGTGPYSFMWTPDPPNGQGTPQLTGLPPGTWTVTVTDALAAEATQDFTLTNQPYLPDLGMLTTWAYDGSAAHHPCPGFQNGSICVITSLITGGTPPYTVTMNGQGPLGYDINTNEPYFGYFSANDMIGFEVTDANGCTGGGQIFNDGPTTLGASASNINPACGGLANGSAEITYGYAGPYGPSLWVGGPNGEVFNDIPTWEPLQLTGLEAGGYTIYGAYLPQYFPAPGCDYNGYFTIPDLGSDCGTVSGHVYIDNDQDCTQDMGEPSIPYRVMEILPGPEYAITNALGNYTRNLVNGNYTIEPQGTGTELYPICPPVQPAAFTINFNSATVDIADSSLVPLDVQLMANNGQARPGFAHSIWADVRNLSAQIGGAGVLTLTFDPQMSYVSASPVPSSISGNTLTWDLPALLAYADMDFGIQLMVPPNAGLIGSPFSHVLTVTQPLTEATTANNSVGLSGVFVGSYDPNDKQVFTSSRWSPDLYYINEDEWLDYTIRFQNTGTAEAIDVVVTDTLSEVLDMATFQQGAASHPFDVSFRSGRVVEWRFANINLPDSGANEAASHGAVSFRIRPQLPLVPGTVIANNADIFFDFNDPIRTNDAVLTAEFSTGLRDARLGDLQVYPNPVDGQLMVALPHAEQARLLDLTGRTVVERRMSSDRLLLDLEGLPAGTYLVRVTNLDGQSFTRPVTKQ